jgi:TetR/AcrR family transcriptional regulator, cholesterol catabolism regulator
MSTSEKQDAKPAKTTRESRSRGKSAFDRRRTLALENGKEPYQEKRREIAKAAAEVFDQHGFRGTTLGAVADAVGMSRAALYYYIPNKRELFDELVREAIETNVAGAEAIRARKGSAVDKLRAMIVGLMRSCGTHYPLFYIYIRENLAHVEARRTEWSRNVRELNRRYEEILVSTVQDGINEGSLRPVASPRIIVYGIFGMIGWTSRWFNPHTSLESAETIGEAFADMALNGIKA